MKFKNGLPIVLTWVALCTFTIPQGSLAPLALPIGRDFGLGVDWSGLFFAAVYIVNIVACPLFGKLTAVIGARFAVSVGLLVFGSASLLLSFADRLLFVCLSLSALGAGAAFVLLGGVGYLSSLTGRAHAYCIPAASIPMGAGAALGAVCNCLTLTRALGWRRLYFWLGIVVLTFDLLYTVLPLPKAEPDPKWKVEFGSALRLRRMYSFYSLLFVYAGAEICATCLLAGYMLSLGYTSVIAAIAGVLMWVCVVGGRVLCARLLPSCPPTRMTVALTLVLVCSLCLCAAVPDGKLFWAAVFGVGLGLSGLWVLLTCKALGGTGGGATFSAALLWECAGAACVPTAMRWIGRLAGMRAVILLTAGLFAVAGIAMLKLLEPPKGGYMVGYRRSAKQTDEPVE